jgi:hypothetical protein
MTTIAQCTGYDRSTIIDTLAELVELEWIVRQHDCSTSGWFASNRYQLRVPSYDTPAHAAAERERARVVARTAGPPPPAPPSTPSPRVFTAAPQSASPKASTASPKASTTASPSREEAEASAKAEAEVLAELQAHPSLHLVAAPSHARELWEVAKGAKKSVTLTREAIRECALKTPRSSAEASSVYRLTGRLRTWIVNKFDTTGADTDKTKPAETSLTTMLQGQLAEERADRAHRATATGPSPELVAWMQRSFRPKLE